MGTACTAKAQEHVVLLGRKRGVLVPEWACDGWKAHPKRADRCRTAGLTAHSAHHRNVLRNFELGWENFTVSGRRFFEPSEGKCRRIKRRMVTATLSAHTVPVQSPFWAYARASLRPRTTTFAILQVLVEQTQQRRHCDDKIRSTQGDF